MFLPAYRALSLSRALTLVLDLPAGCSGEPPDPKITKEIQTQWQFLQRLELTEY